MTWNLYKQLFFMDCFGIVYLFRALDTLTEIVVYNKLKLLINGLLSIMPFF